MAPKAKKDDKKKGKTVAVTSKKAEEARKKELVQGEGAGRLKVLESLHCTGVLTSRPASRDVRIEQVTMSIYGRELFRDATLKINHGRRYGLIGHNGSGKTTLLAALAARELPIPDHIDLWFVHCEAEPTETSALQAVVDTAAKEYARLEELIMKLSEEDAEANAEIIEALAEKQDKMDPASFVPEAGALLHGLGFGETMMHKATKDMSGGWRMRVALAQALFKKPTLLILDEPTNHLDLGACVWLEEYLAKYPSTIILTSHSEDFMNTVCTDIMQLRQDQKLQYWGGNYEAYVQTRQEQEVNQMKAYEKEQADIQHLLEFIRSCGTFSNMRRQADSKQKIIDKMKEDGLTEKPMPDPKFMFNFPDTEKLPPPVLAFDRVCFSYSGKKEDYLYKDVDFGIDSDSCIALVGPNGAGKSTLLKLMRGDLEATEGTIKRNSHLRFASYNQHSAEVLPLDKSPLQFLQEKFDKEAEERGEQRKSEQEWRAKLGKYGVAGDLQKRKMGTFSDGQKARVVFALMSLANPHLLLLDEPTNHLDLEACIWLEDHLSRYKKCLFVISHSQDFLNTVCTHIVWLNQTKLSYYGGNYDAFCKAVDDEERVNMKTYEKQQADIEKLSTFVRVNRANGVATSAKSKKKVLEKVQDEAVDRPKVRQCTLQFSFEECTLLEPPVLPFDQVAFSYSGKKEDYLYEKLDLGVDCDSRVALVGPNGCGKSTLVKLMSGELHPTEGAIKRHQHLVMGQFHQHSADVLEPDMSPLAFMKKQFPPPECKRTEEVWRSYLAMFGFTSKQMTAEIGMLSDGQKSRLVFAMLAMKPYNLLLLDEPTNHLDVDSVDGLAEAIRNFQGGVVLVSHDFRLIDQVAKEIWVCEDRGVRKYDGNIASYKKVLAKKVGAYKV